MMQFMEDQYGTLIIRTSANEIKFIGRVANGKFYFGTFEKDTSLEATGSVKSLDESEINQILERLHKSGPP